MPNLARVLLRVLPCVAALAANDLDGHFSNQAIDGPVILTLCPGCAQAADVLFAPLDPPEGAHRRPAPVRLTAANRSVVLTPGQTAVLTFVIDPAEGSVRQRHFQVTRPGGAERVGFILEAAVRHGLRSTEVRPDPGCEAHAVLDRVDPDLLVLWDFLD